MNAPIKTVVALTVLASGLWGMPLPAAEKPVEVVAAEGGAALADARRAAQDAVEQGRAEAKNINRAPVADANGPETVNPALYRQIKAAVRRVHACYGVFTPAFSKGCTDSAVNQVKLSARRALTRSIVEPQKYGSPLDYQMILEAASSFECTPIGRDGSWYDYFCVEAYTEGIVSLLPQPPASAK